MALDVAAIETTINTTHATVFTVDGFVIGVVASLVVIGIIIKIVNGVNGTVSFMKGGR